MPVCARHQKICQILYLYDLFGFQLYLLCANEIFAILQVLCQYHTKPLLLS